MWWDTSGYSITSAFFMSVAFDGHSSHEETTTLTTPSHATEKELVLQTLSSNEQTGLSATQVAAAREQFGWNELATVAPEPAWKKFLAQFSDVVVWILIAAAVISGAMGEWTNTAALDL